MTPIESTGPIVELFTLDRGSGTGQTPIRIPFQYDPTGTIDIGGTTHETNKTHFGLEILVCSGASAFCWYANLTPHSIAFQANQGFMTIMDGVICFMSAGDGSHSGNLVEIYEQGVLEQQVQAYGGVADLNRGFGQGYYLALKDLNSTVGGVVVMGIKWLQDGVI